MQLFLFSLVAAAIAGALKYYLKPRLPLYSITPLLLKQLPTVRKIDNSWAIVILSEVEFFNENFIHLDVYSLMFDIIDVFETSTVGIKNNTSSPTVQKRILGTAIAKHQPETTETSIKPIWSISARSKFTAQTVLQIRLSFYDLISSISSLVSRAWSGNGQITLPTTGIVHVKVSPASTLSKQIAVAMTLGIICDNTLNAFSMQVFGAHCVMQKIHLGWMNIDVAASSLRKYAVNHLEGNATTGGILNKKVRQKS
jgi:hypothetical protein